LGELHFIPSFSCLASPLMILAAAAQRTKRIRLGTAVTLLPLHNPVKMAEDAATLDVLSNGRLEFGIGREATPVYFAGYNILQEESRERFEESREVILRAWTSERLSYEGKYFRVQDVRLTPQPVQKPYPPIRIAAYSSDTFAIAGQLGGHQLHGRGRPPDRRGAEILRWQLFGHWPHRDSFCFAVDFQPDRTGGIAGSKIHLNRRSANA
jgi:alkanesulfonate monooxygenase SsuD/methylene tetrahydromethanopterin reductase-like flavin-dependent oxidoreductase (luciferase family)